MRVKRVAEGFMVTDFYILLGDAVTELAQLHSDSVQLVFTSPPYADQRKNTYGGIHPDEYVDWFLPISRELLRVLHPRGTFILNIKEKAVNGERHTYVLDLIRAMREQGWLWTEEFIWHKKTHILENGPIVFEILGNVFSNSTNAKNSICIRKKLWCLLGIGQKHV